jgi:hypothetical protein
MTCDRGQVKLIGSVHSVWSDAFQIGALGGFDALKCAESSGSVLVDHPYIGFEPEQY